MYAKICVVVAVLNIITCVKFGTEIFSGLDFTGGRIFGFPILIVHGPYNSAALLYNYPRLRPETHRDVC